MRVGDRINRDHGALKLRAAVLQGDRRPYASVQVLVDGRVIGEANSSSFTSSGDHYPVSDIVRRIAAKLAVDLARSIES